MNILISCLSFGSLTGSELYVLELAKELAKNHNVHVLAKHTTDLFEGDAKKYGFKIHGTPPNFFIGDGVRKYVDNGEEKVTQNNAFYKIDNKKFDLILLNHAKIGWPMDMFYKDTPCINIIHSEIIPRFEDPLIHPNIKGYIAIRKSIKDHLVNNFDIPEENVAVIENPVDTEKYNTKDTNNNGYVLFVGSYDYLRKNAISDLIKRTRSEGKKLILIGRDMPDFHQAHVKSMAPFRDIEKITKNADAVASILYGRTAIEGYLCGKPAILYDVNDKGQINCVEIKDADPKDAYERHNPTKVVERILDYARQKIRFQ